MKGWKAATPAEILAENARLRQLLAEQRAEMEAMVAAIVRYRAVFRGAFTLLHTTLDNDQEGRVWRGLPPLEKRPPRPNKHAPLFDEDRYMMAYLCAMGYSRLEVAQAYDVSLVTILNAIEWAAQKAGHNA